jgi:hypothetical protein
MKGIILLVALLFAAPGYAGQGWYLMLPPKLTRDGPSHDAPLRIWDHNSSFDSATACEEVLRGWQTSAKERFQRVASPENKLRNDQVWGGRCIASDDPRLK